MARRQFDRDLYEVLEVKSTASPEELKQAYRRQAMQEHPDLKQDAAEKEAATLRFQKINEAYEVLSDPVKRVQYDSMKAVNDYTPSNRWRNTSYETYQSDTAFTKFTERTTNLLEQGWEKITSYVDQEYTSLAKELGKAYLFEDKVRKQELANKLAEIFDIAFENSINHRLEVIHAIEEDKRNTLNSEMLSDTSKEEVIERLDSHKHDFEEAENERQSSPQKAQKQKQHLIASIIAEFPPGHFDPPYSQWVSNESVLHHFGNTWKIDDDKHQAELLFKDLGKDHVGRIEYGLKIQEFLESTPVEFEMRNGFFKREHIFVQGAENIERLRQLIDSVGGHRQETGSSSTEAAMLLPPSESPYTEPAPETNSEGSTLSSKKGCWAGFKNAIAVATAVTVAMIGNFGSIDQSIQHNTRPTADFYPKQEIVQHSTQSQIKDTQAVIRGLKSYPELKELQGLGAGV